MPELPEVENVVRSLRPWLVGRRITGIELPEREPDGAPRPALRRILLQPVGEFQRALCGASIEDVKRYGKNILFLLSPASGRNGKLSLWVHLGMTGRLTWEATPEFRDRHTHFVLSLDAPGRWLHYTDIRQFGRIRVTKGLAPEIEALGPDPLEVSLEEFYRRLHCRRAMVKSLLLNQRFLRGLGNIYADESLFRAGIHPAAIAARLSRERARRLYQGIRETLREAIQQGGSSISNYVNAQGRPGRFQRLHQVYRRTAQPCFRCGARVRRILIASRSTHFCPRCQSGARRSVPKRRLR